MTKEDLRVAVVLLMEIAAIGIQTNAQQNAKQENLIKKKKYLKKK